MPEAIFSLSFLIIISLLCISSSGFSVTIGLFAALLELIGLGSNAKRPVLSESHRVYKLNKDIITQQPIY